MIALSALPAGLYGIVDVQPHEPDDAVIDRGRFLVDHGAGAVQLRAKHHTVGAVARLAERLLPLVSLLVINDHVDVAVVLGAWAHVGQDDGPDPAIPFGRSTHTRDQVLHTTRAPSPVRAAYIGFGPVFATETKATGYSARGLVLLADVVARSPVPVVAIGGITADNIDEVKGTGVHAWAPISGFWTLRQDADRLQRFLLA